MTCAASLAIPSRALPTSATFLSASARQWASWLDSSRFPFPESSRITLGLAGVLLVALGLGHIRRTGIVWTLPLSANMVLRNFGLTVFLAQVGLASGPQFAAVAESGFTLLLLGAIIMLALIVVTMLAGRLLAIPADDLFGVISGVTGNPAILAYRYRAVPTDRPDISYAIVFPTVTVLKILFVQIAAAVLRQLNNPICSAAPRLDRSRRSPRRTGDRQRCDHRHQHRHHDEGDEVQRLHAEQH